ncbi:hypothetical protein HanIR_Chr04g0206611 [Helianthus annuus]|nr:hypothetical protein HanIR_Chr04g0206611 [Helianthus annuus]
MRINSLSKIRNQQQEPIINSKVIHSVDGKLQEFRQPITASHVLSDHPDTFFLCSSENMFVNWHVPHVSGDEELEPGQIYFIMPVSKSFKPLSLQELCLLAVKASSAIEQSSEMEKKKVGKRCRLVDWVTVYGETRSWKVVRNVTILIIIFG